MVLPKSSCKFIKIIGIDAFLKFFCNSAEEMNLHGRKVRNTISEYFKTKPIDKAWVLGSYKND